MGISSRFCLMRNKTCPLRCRRLLMVQEDRKLRRRKRTPCTALISRMKLQWRNWKPKKYMSHSTIQTTNENGPQEAFSKLSESESMRQFASICVSTCSFAMFHEVDRFHHLRLDAVA